jgi:hypothetical protein
MKINVHPGVVAVVIIAVFLILLGLGVSFNLIPKEIVPISNDSSSQKPILKPTQNNDLYKISPIGTQNTSITYNDKELSEIILKNGSVYLDASSTFFNATKKGNFDLADNESKVLIRKLVDEKFKLSKMNIQNDLMRSSWNSYLEDESLFLYQIGQEITNTKENDMAKVESSQVIASKHQDDANTFYMSAKNQALKY